jgi:acetylornithine deacetylase/succinyl-diaminopimelate desuccinylase-like protein
MKQRDFIELLTKLVAVDSVSPISGAAMEALTRFFGHFELTRVGDLAVWIRPPRDSRVWAYSHIDTKPPGSQLEWKSNPFVLREDGERLFGLGVCDAKFQALNTLVEFADQPFGIVIDGGEEIGCQDSAAWLAAQAPETLVVVDGACEADELYAGTMGQLDGTVRFRSNLAPVHPARVHRTGALDWICALAAETRRLGLRFTMTGIETELRERSLTAEQLSLRFDLRFGPADAEAVAQFVSRYQPQLRQHYSPLVGRRCQDNAGLAPFSSALGSVLQNVEEVLVVPGGLPENGNHRPNEWIYHHQIESHQNRLRAVAAALLAR